MIDPKYLRKDGGIKNLGVPPEIKTQWFIEKAKEVHGGTYDYSKQVYTRSIEKLEIACKEHGSFFQSPNNHLKKQGCPTCATQQSQERYKDTKEQFIGKQVQVHGATYTYESVEYINCMTKVYITCPYHGDFLQSPDNHIRGRQGCPSCKGKTADTVYVLKCLDTGLIKIGITKDLERRVREIGNVSILSQIKHKDPRQVETKLHNRFKEFRRTNHKALSGNTEFFQLSYQDIQALKEELMREVICA